MATRGARRGAEERRPRLCFRSRRGGSGGLGGAARDEGERRGMQGLALQVQEQLKRDPHAGDLYVFRGRRGDLAKILWHDGVGLSLYAKRLDRGRFIWPSTTAGVLSISAAQMAYMLEGIDWRNPQLTWRPERAG
jgi:transposase